MNDFTYFLFLRSAGMIINHSSIDCRDTQVGLSSAPILRLSFFRAKQQNLSQSRQKFLVVLAPSPSPVQVCPNSSFRSVRLFRADEEDELSFTVNWNDKQCSQSSGGEGKTGNQLAKQRRAKAIPHFCTTAVLRITLVDQFSLSGENEGETERERGGEGEKRGTRKQKRISRRKKIRDRLILSPSPSLSTN